MKHNQQHTHRLVYSLPICALRFGRDGVKVVSSADDGVQQFVLLAEKP